MYKLSYSLKTAHAKRYIIIIIMINSQQIEAAIAGAGIAVIEAVGLRSKYPENDRIRQGSWKMYMEGRIAVSKRSAIALANVMFGSDPSVLHPP